MRCFALPKIHGTSLQWPRWRMPPDLKYTDYKTNLLAVCPLALQQSVSACEASGPACANVNIELEGCALTTRWSDCIRLRFVGFGDFAVALSLLFFLLNV